jgi:hypothetical protein
MVVKLIDGSASSREGAFNVCAEACATVSYSTMKKSVKSYWLLAGIGAYAAGNWFFDKWSEYAW